MPWNAFHLAYTALFFIIDRLHCIKEAQQPFQHIQRFEQVLCEPRDKILGQGIAVFRRICVLSVVFVLWAKGRQLALTLYAIDV